MEPHTIGYLIAGMAILLILSGGIYFAHLIRSSQDKTQSDLQKLALGWKDSLNQDLQQQLFQASQQQYQHFDNFQKQLAGVKYDMINQLDQLRSEQGQNLQKLNEDNRRQLDKMHTLVHEKLHHALEERLGTSFKMVQESLLKVQAGLGEMQSLASGVGDLKKVLSNVKTRGILGEIQLGNILEEILAPDQYEINVATIPHSRNHVEFAIKFPGKNQTKPIWLPIDAKFPLDIYHGLLKALEGGNLETIAVARKTLSTTIKKMAGDIHHKYIHPPHTTDFGILFLPVEGLYAEVARDTPLLQLLQKNYRIMIAGPSNLAAFLNSLRIGFRTLAIEQRSTEVWNLLESIRSEFGIFEEILTKTQKKLQEASNVIDKARGKTTTINRKLSNIEHISYLE